MNAPMPIAVKSAALVAALVLLAGACDGNDAGSDSIPTAETPTVGSPAPPPDGGDATVSLELVAQDTSFDRETMTVSAGAEVSLTLANADPLPHNFALYQTEEANESIFIGEQFSGPDAEQTYTFTAPSEPGDYLFRCDVHPTQMTGTFIVE